MINSAGEILAPPGLASFGEELSAAVIGASGDLGGAFVEALERAPAVARLAVLSQEPKKPQSPKTAWQAIDLESEDSIAEAAQAVAGTGPGLNLVIVTTGMIRADDERGTAGSRREFDAAELNRAFAVNAIGPALIAKHFLPRLARGRKTAFAAVSTRVGSTEDARLGSMHAYRASKAALNMLIRTLAMDLARSNDEAVCVALHPGTVTTARHGSRKSGTAAKEPVTPTEVATRLLEVLDSLSPGHSGGLFAWDGQRILF